MKLLIIFLLSFTLALQSMGQGIDYNFGSVNTKASDEIISDVFHMHDSSFVVIKKFDQKKNQIAICFFDSTFKLISEEKIELPVEKITEVHLLGNQICAFGMAFNAATSIDEFSAFTFKNDGSYTQNILSTIKSNGGYHNTFDVSVSPNQKYLSLIRSGAHVKGQKENLEVTSYDSLFTEIHSTKIGTSILSSKKRVNVLITNNDGLSYILKKQRIKGGANYFIYTITKEGSEDHGSIRLKSRKIADMDYVLKEDGSLVVAGFYSSPISRNYEGFFVKKFKGNVVSEFSKEYAFNVNVFEAFKTKKELKTTGYSLPNFHLKDLIQLNEKNYILTAEHHSLYSNGKSDPEDYRRGIVAIGITYNGGFKYASPILTQQNDGVYMGYWSSHQIVNNDGKPILYLNKMGEGAKKLKDQKLENTGMIVESISFNKSGLPIPNFDGVSASVDKYCINSTFNNTSTIPVLCVESLDQKSYSLGVLK